MEGLLITLILGGVAGWIAGQLFKGRGLGLLGNIVVGIIGAYIGYWGLGKLGIHLGSGWVGYIATAAIGAIALLAILNIFSRRR